MSAHDGRGSAGGRGHAHSHAHAHAHAHAQPPGAMPVLNQSLERDEQLRIMLNFGVPSKRRPLVDETGRLCYYAKRCEYYKESRSCPNGARCQFAHHHFETMYHPAVFKTALCDEQPNCPHQVCSRAHGVNDQRDPQVMSRYRDHGPALAAAAIAAVTSAPAAPDMGYAGLSDPGSGHMYPPFDQGGSYGSMGPFVDYGTPTQHQRTHPHTQVVITPPNSQPQTQQQQQQFQVPDLVHLGSQSPGSHSAVSSAGTNYTFSVQSQGAGGYLGPGGNMPTDVVVSGSGSDSGASGSGIDVATYKVARCLAPDCHGSMSCVSWHDDYDRRRDPAVFSYGKDKCPHFFLQRRARQDEPPKKPCPFGDNCQFAHNVFERSFHRDSYRRIMCDSFLTGEACPRGRYCAFAHTLESCMSTLVSVQAYADDPRSFYLLDYKVHPCPFRHSRKDPDPNCPYFHSWSDRRRAPDVHPYDAVPCPDWEEHRKCPRGDECRRAHGPLEVFYHPTNYKTRYYCDGGVRCRGERCALIHEVFEQRKPSDPLPQRRKTVLPGSLLKRRVFQPPSNTDLSPVGGISLEQELASYLPTIAAATTSMTASSYEPQLESPREVSFGSLGTASPLAASTVSPQERHHNYPTPPVFEQNVRKQQQQMLQQQQQFQYMEQPLQAAQGHAQRTRGHSLFGASSGIVFDDQDDSRSTQSAQAGGSMPAASPQMYMNQHDLASAEMLTRRSISFGGKSISPTISLGQVHRSPGVSPVRPSGSSGPGSEGQGGGSNVTSGGNTSHGECSGGDTETGDESQVTVSTSSSKRQGPKVLNAVQRVFLKVPPASHNAALGDVLNQIGYSLAFVYCEAGAALGRVEEMLSKSLHGGWLVRADTNSLCDTISQVLRSQFAHGGAVELGSVGQQVGDGGNRIVVLTNTSRWDPAVGAYSQGNLLLVSLAGGPSSQHLGFFETVVRGRESGIFGGGHPQLQQGPSGRGVILIEIAESVGPQSCSTARLDEYPAFAGILTSFARPRTTATAQRQSVPRLIEAIRQQQAGSKHSGAPVVLATGDAAAAAAAASAAAVPPPASSLVTARSSPLVLKIDVGEPCKTVCGTVEAFCATLCDEWSDDNAQAHPCLAVAVPAEQAGDAGRLLRATRGVDRLPALLGLFESEDGRRWAAVEPVWATLRELVEGVGGQPKPKPGDMDPRVGVLAKGEQTGCPACMLCRRVSRPQDERAMVLGWDRAPLCVHEFHQTCLERALRSSEQFVCPCQSLWPGRNRGAGESASESDAALAAAGACIAAQLSRGGASTGLGMAMSLGLGGGGASSSQSCEVCETGQAGSVFCGSCSKLMCETCASFHAYMMPVHYLAPASMAEAVRRCGGGPPPSNMLRLTAESVELVRGVLESVAAVQSTGVSPVIDPDSLVFDGTPTGPMGKVLGWHPLLAPSESRESAMWRARADEDRESESRAVFEAGLLVFYLLTGGLHAFGRSEAECVENMDNNKPVYLLALRALPDGLDLVSHMLQGKAEQRPSLGQALDHPFFWTASTKVEVLLAALELSELRPELRLLNESSDLVVKAIGPSPDRPSKARDWRSVADRQFLRDLVEVVRLRGGDGEYNATLVGLLRAVRDCRRHGGVGLAATGSARQGAGGGPSNQYSLLPESPVMRDHKPMPGGGGSSDVYVEGDEMVQEYFLRRWFPHLLTAVCQMLKESDDASEWIARRALRVQRYFEKTCFFPREVGV